MLAVELTGSQIDLLGKFLAELRSYNEHTNLVSNADPEVVVRDHVMDGLSLVPIINRLKPEVHKLRLVDIGSGAGFPAMVLAIVIPELHVLLIDSVGKKTRFLTEAASTLGLESRVSVVNARAEELPHDRRYRESFDFATARAVGKLDLVAELALPFIRLNGFLLAQKSQAQLEEEMEAADNAISVLGGEIASVENLDAEVLQRQFAVVCVRKARQTPREFPRPTAQLKRPI
jgi:16S rRNA (guanine527-N7)-methyltransferase